MALLSAIDENNPEVLLHGEELLWVVLFCHAEYLSYEGGEVYIVQLLSCVVTADHVMFEVLESSAHIVDSCLLAQ